MNIRRVRAIVSGKVQGVFYRKSTVDEAQQRSLSGWVKNLADGRVEFVAEGKSEAVESLIEWAKNGPPFARVSGIELFEETPIGDKNGFWVQR